MTEQHEGDWTRLHGADPAEGPPAEPELAAELLAMSAADHGLQAGAHGEDLEARLAWRAVTVRNGDRLREILAAGGWPGPARVGTAGARAAWLVAQHADHQLDVQREALRLMTQAMETGQADRRQVALMEDRVAVNEGRRQRYGTQIAGVVDGRPVPWPCADPDRTDEFRVDAGLEAFDAHVGRFTGERPADA